MSRLGELMGSNTRGNMVEALALSEKPLTAYGIARSYNMNVAKVYREMKRLVGLGLAGSAGRRRGKEYFLADDDLKRLALKLSSRVQTYDSWRSEDARRSRFRMGLASVPDYSLGAPSEPMQLGQKKMPGELENLAALGRKKFDSKYRKGAGGTYDRV